MEKIITLGQLIQANCPWGATFLGRKGLTNSPNQVAQERSGFGISNQVAQGEKNLEYSTKLYEEKRNVEIPTKLLLRTTSSREKKTFLVRERTRWQPQLSSPWNIFFEQKEAFPKESLRNLVGVGKSLSPLDGKFLPPLGSWLGLPFSPLFLGEKPLFNGEGVPCDNLVGTFKSFSLWDNLIECSKSLFLPWATWLGAAIQSSFPQESHSPRTTSDLKGKPKVKKGQMFMALIQHLVGHSDYSQLCFAPNRCCLV